MIEIISIQASVTKVMIEVSKSLALFLDKELPNIIDDWWSQAVINRGCNVLSVISFPIRYA